MLDICNPDEILKRISGKQQAPEMTKNSQYSDKMNWKNWRDNNLIKRGQKV